MRNRNNCSFHVAPRYSGGSPAMVDISTAMRVAAQEIQCAVHCVEGIYGEEKRNEYRKKGLRGIVFLTYEKKGYMFIQDVLTNELFRVKLREYGGGGWGAWHWKSKDEQEKYLWHGDEAPLYRVELEPLKADRSVLEAFDMT